jgi:hypothetical protein
LISAEADFAGQLEFLAPDRWLFLGKRDDPDVTELYTAGIEPIQAP